MTLLFLSGPSVEPVSLAEAKAHLKVDTADEDALIGSLILTSRLHAEAALGLAFIQQQWRLLLDTWPPGGAVTLPLRPVTSIDAVRVLASDGTPTTLPPSSYALEPGARRQRLIPESANWPLPGRRALGIEIDFTAGFGVTSASVPEDIRHAILLLVAHWYEHRDVIEIGSAATRIPSIVSELLANWREPRL
ncbi:MAG: head-tail connector protein [Hyphomicrobium sp.]|nr:head-tail connector protein [Hyphomicrobium sp.]